MYCRQIIFPPFNRPRPKKVISPPHIEVVLEETDSAKKSTKIVKEVKEKEEKVR